MARAHVVMRSRRQTSIVRLAIVCTIGFSAPASAQNLFEVLFGGLRRAMTPQRPPSVVNPNAGYAEGYGTPSSGYCVRLCDGRYFPVNGRGRISAADMCRAFCPGTQTQIFSGSSNVAHAVAPNGQRYASLPNAFLFREKLVPDCTCDGKSATGLVRFDGPEDPTLRDGDIVATGGGLMSYRTDARGAGYTPISNVPGMSPKLREQLTATKVAPGRAEELPIETDGETVPLPDNGPRPQALR